VAPAPGHGATDFFLGIGVHLAMSALFGLVYGFLMVHSTGRQRDSYLVEGLFGAFYGLLLWLVNFQLIARLFYPQLGTLSWGAQLLAHTLAFGVPLGWFLCAKLRDVEVPGVHTLRHKLQTPSGSDEVQRTRRDLGELPVQRRS
jgi:hypothetical protein